MQSHALAALAGLLARTTHQERIGIRGRAQKAAAEAAEASLARGRADAGLVAAAGAEDHQAETSAAAAAKVADEKAAAAERAARMVRQPRVVFVPDCKQLVEAGADY